MKYNKEKFVGQVKKAAMDEKVGRSGATSGRVCAIASLRFLRDSLVDDLYGTPVPKEVESDAAALRECFLELIQEVAAGTAEDGFCSNASAAAKAAGFKSSQITVNLSEMTE